MRYAAPPPLPLPPPLTADFFLDSAWPPGQACAASRLALPVEMAEWIRRGLWHATPGNVSRPQLERQPLPRKAALVLRGRAPPLSDQQEVALYYKHMVLRPLHLAGFAVDTFVTSYELVDGFASLSPITLNIMHEDGSSNLAMTVASMVAFYDYCASRRVSHDFIVLTRMDLRFKQPLVELPGLRWNGINFAFRESSGEWRKRGWTSVHQAWDDDRRVSDTVHAFAGDLLTCFLLGLAFYAVHPDEQLHYLYGAVERFAPPGRMSFMVNGSYDSDPAKGMLNPVYDIVPRYRQRYDGSLCRKLADFAYDAHSDSFCCANPPSGYCCPNSRKSCAG